MVDTKEFNYNIQFLPIRNSLIFKKADIFTLIKFTRTYLVDCKNPLPLKKEVFNGILYCNSINGTGQSVFTSQLTC